MLQAFLVALTVFVCVGGAELAGFTMLNRPIVIGPLVGLFLGDLHTGVIVGAALEAVFMGVVNIGGASAAEPGIATAVGTAFAIMLGKGTEVALTLALPIGILGLQIKTVLYIFFGGHVCQKIRPAGVGGEAGTDRGPSLRALGGELAFVLPGGLSGHPFRLRGGKRPSGNDPRRGYERSYRLRRPASGSGHGHADENAVGQQNLYFLFPGLCAYGLLKPALSSPCGAGHHHCRGDRHERLPI